MHRYLGQNPNILWPVVLDRFAESHAEFVHRNTFKLRTRRLLQPPSDVLERLHLRRVLDVEYLDAWRRQRKTEQRKTERDGIEAGKKVG